MRFILKAIFFLAVVAAFIPRQPGAEAAPHAAVEIQIPEIVNIAPQQAADDFCAERPALCAAARESAMAARLVGGIAVQQARHALADAMAADAAGTPLETVPAPETTPAP